MMCKRPVFDYRALFVCVAIAVAIPAYCLDIFRSISGCLFYLLDLSDKA